MHNNFYFLRQLSSELAHRLEGYSIVSCFSQNKDELILEFNNTRTSFFVKADLQPEFQCLSFPEKFSRARKNSIDLFPEIILQPVSTVRQFNNERSFAIVFKNAEALVFKMHGTRANVVLYRGQTAVDLFKNNFSADLEVPLNTLDRDINWSKENFIEHQFDLKQTYFTIGNVIWEELARAGFETANPEARWIMLQKMLAQLEVPKFHIHENENTFKLTLLPKEGVRAITNPVEALNEFYNQYVVHHSFQKEKIYLVSQLNGKLKQASAFLKKNESKLNELTSSRQYQQWGDLLMANLSHIRQGQDQVQLENFYDDQKPVTIKLKTDLSPQKNAEAFYRKAKNQSIEIKNLEASITKKRLDAHQWKSELEIINKATSLSDLKSISSKIRVRAEVHETKPALPYREFEFKGFRIWVGKHAAANDELTLKHSFKEDLWLHARDVAGSHVLIKYQSGKLFPKDVIERAASLAAFFSKRKNESLCPVAFTPKKYVRKRKGDPAGAVVVEREEVVLVEPSE